MKKLNNMKFIITVDGPDCIGKTTFLNNFLFNIDYVLSKLNKQTDLYFFLKNIKNKQQLILKKTIKNKILNLGLYYYTIKLLEGKYLIVYLKESNEFYEEYKYINNFRFNDFFSYLPFFLLIRKRIFNNITKVNNYFKNYNILYLVDRSFISSIIYQFGLSFNYLNYELIDLFYNFNLSIAQHNILQDLFILFSLNNNIDDTFNFVYNNLRKTLFKDDNINSNVLFKNVLFKKKTFLLKRKIFFYNKIFNFLNKKNDINIILADPNCCYYEK
jgi:thymidylate kinase